MIYVAVTCQLQVVAVITHVTGNYEIISTEFKCSSVNLDL